jgi:hypothetical protein
MNKYYFFIGIYDHKQGPIAICPSNANDMFKMKDIPPTIIQDGLNTKSKVMTVKNYNDFIQIYKFSLSDPRLRGNTLRCCLFCIVPSTSPLIPNESLMEIIIGILDGAKKSDSNLGSPLVETILKTWEDQFNSQLSGTIGQGQIEHQTRELLNTIIGNAQLLLDGVLGNLNEDQKESITFILKYSNELMNLKQYEE